MTTPPAPPDPPSGEPGARPYRPGNAEDFDRLYRVAYPRILATVVGMLRDREAAEDCTQEAFVRAYRAWPRWREVAPAEAWLHRIAINVAVSHRRRERLRQVGELVRRLGQPAPGPDPTSADGSVLTRELATLPPKQAAVIVLRHLHGYSNREIAVALRVPEQTVASRLAAAKTRLRARLGSEYLQEVVDSSSKGVSSGEDAPGK
ncbi:MAG: RNA polymerase sigma factor [Candidatus Dormibacteraeota bacterium]|nr:RNA polymerase sigma factor [Candidatus Dormibacteraeota bacterium]